MSQVKFDNGAIVPLTPPAGQTALYSKPDGFIYSKNTLTGEVGPFGSGGGGLPVGPGNVVYMALPPRGNNATGTLGDASKPFADLANALAVCVDGGALVIGPGSYAIPATPPTIPNNLTVIGYGETSTFLLGALNIDVLVLPSTMTNLHLSDLAIVTLGTGRCVRGTGDAAKVFLNGAIPSFRNVALQAPPGIDAVFLSYAHSLLVTGSNISRVTLDTCARSEWVGTEVNNDFRISWDDDNGLLKPAVRGAHKILNSDLGDLRLYAGQPNIDVDISSDVGDIFLIGAVKPVSLLAPKITFAGQADNININLPVAGAAFPNFSVGMDFNNSRFQSLVITGDPATTQNATAHGCVPNFGATINIQDGINFFVFSDTLGSTSLITPAPTGSITPSRITRQVASAAAVTTSINFAAAPFRASSAPTTVIAMGTAPLGFLSNVSRSNNNVVIGHINAGVGPSIDVEIRWT